MKAGALHILLSGAAALVFAVGAGIQPAYAQERAAASFDIKAGPLGRALEAFAQQSREQILFAPELVRNKRAAALNGTYSSEAALQRLLRGSGLAYRKTSRGAFVIEAAGSLKVAKEPAAVIRQSANQVASDMPEPAEDTTIVVIGTAGAGKRLQDTAYAVTRIDDEAIEQASPASTADLFKLIPGVSAESSGGQNGANIFVRGYPSGGDAEYVTLQTQGVPFFPPPTLSFLENSQLIRIDETLLRVEAVRGGTGALFSSGQPGLTINFVQREGGARVEGLLKGSITTFGEVRGDAVISGPLGPDTSFMVGGYYAQSDGVRDANFTAEKGGQITANIRHDFGNGSLLVFGRYLNDHGQWLLPVPVVQDGSNITKYPGFNPGHDTFLGPLNRTGTLNDGTAVDVADGRGAQIVNLGANLEYDLSENLVVRNRSSYLSGNADTVGQVPGGIPPLSATAYAASRGGNIVSLTDVATGSSVDPATDVIPVGVWEVRKDIEAFVNDLALELSTGRNTLTGGFYYADYSSDDRWNLGNAQLLAAEPNARRLELVIDNNGTLQEVTRDGFAGGSFFNVNAGYTGSDIALYLVNELEVTDQLRIDAGIRYQEHRIEGRLENNTFGVDTDGDPNTLYNNGTAVLNGSFTDIDYKGDDWSWTVGANYAPTSDYGFFARYSRGNSFPFFDNLRDGLRQTQQVDSYEIGFKTTTAPIDFYVTAFRNDFEGLATTVIVDGAPLASIGGARTYGLEMEGAVRPVEGLQIAGSLTYLDATYRDFFSDGGTVDNSGNRVQRQPRWQWRINPSYAIQLGTMEATLFTTLSYVGDRFSDVQNQQQLPAFTKWDLGASLELDDHWRLQIVGDNITDTIGLTEGNPRALGSQGSGVILARPILGRSVRFSIAYEF